MALQWRLFAAFGGLIALVLVAQWLMIRDAKERISLEFGKAALSLTEDISEVLDQLGKEQQFRGTHELETLGDKPGQYVIERRVFHTEEEFQAFKQASTKGEVEKTEQEAPLFLNQWEAELDVNHQKIHGQPTKVATFEKRVKVRLDDPAEATSLMLEVHNDSQRIVLPKDGMRGALTRLSQSQMLGSLMILLLGLAAAAFLAHRESKPLRALAGAAKRLGAGDLGTTIPHLGGGREIRQAIKAFNDMSGRLALLVKQAEKHRESRNLAELSDIARGLAHTLRNPLNTLGLSLEELASLQDGHEAAEPLVSQARAQIRRIDQWIRSFLALASEGKGQVENLALAHLLEDIALEVMQQDRRGVGIQLLPQGELPMLPGVAPELRAVIQALVVNAMEASPENGSVTLTVEKKAQALVLQVLDRGSGLPEEVRDRLFTPHVTTKTYGSGMGLFLAHRIATNRYDGDLKMDPREGGGTCVTLTLPLRNSYESKQHSLS